MQSPSRDTSMAKERRSSLIIVATRLLSPSGCGWTEKSGEIGNAHAGNGGAVCRADSVRVRRQPSSLASGGHQDFVAMRQITDEYGVAEPDAVVPVMVGDERYTFRVWIHKQNPKLWPKPTRWQAPLLPDSCAV
jgi:hypothetical protein